MLYVVSRFCLQSNSLSSDDDDDSDFEYIPPSHEDSDEGSDSGSKFSF